MRSVTLTRHLTSVLPQPHERVGDYHPSGGEQGPAERARQLISAPRARLGPHARGGLLGVRRHRPLLRRAGGGDRVATPPRAPLPAAAGVRAARPGPAGVGGRSPFQRALPRPPHRSSAPRRRGRAEAIGGPGVLPGARPKPAAVGAVARRGPRRRALRGADEDPSRARRRDLRGRHRDRAVRHLGRAAAGGAARPRVGRAPAPEPRPVAGGRAARARDGAGRGHARNPRDAARPPDGGPSHRDDAGERGRARPDGTPGGPVDPVQRSDRAPPPVHVGGSRPRAVQGDQELSSAEPSTTSCSRLWPARSATTCVSMD